MNKSLYAEDGVDIKVGDDFSAFAAGVCRSTYNCSRFIKIKDFAAGNFRGPRGWRFRHMPKGFYCDGAADGVGTKVGIITEALSHRTAGRDLGAMKFADITRWGGIPLVSFNVLDTSKLGEPGSPACFHFAELIRGLGDACRSQGVIMMRGETAELGPFVGSENPDAVTKFNWAGFVVGAYHPRRIITGKSMKVGDAVVALREYGFRSNGLSAVRKAFVLKFGEHWWTNPEAERYIKMAAIPSVLYDKFLAHINGWYSKDFKPMVKLKAIVHLSGGGIPGKFAKDILFPLGLSAELNDLWEPPDIMRLCFDWRRLTIRECYETWNGGQGKLVVMSANDVPLFVAYARHFGIEAKPCGAICPTPAGGPYLDIKSKYNLKIERWNKHDNHKA